MADATTVRLVWTAIDRLAAALEAGRSAELRGYLSAMARFHRYSLGNVLLITWQCPHASHVAGFRAWQRLGRHVRKGERAIRILAPVVYRRGESEDGADRVVAFKTACVFDVSQTEGAPLPEFARVRGDPGTFLERLRVSIALRGIELIYADVPLGMQGWTSGGCIVVRRGLPPAEEFSVLIHELAHWLLHRNGSAQVSRRVRETEAEAIAFVVDEAIGLETGSAASDYIQLYNGNRDTLLDSLEQIQRTAAEIIADVTAEEAPIAATGEPLSPAVQRPAA